MNSNTTNSINPSNNTFDVIVIGAGSVGTPTAMYLAERKMRVLCLDELPSEGQGQNKRAIGGVRATHSDPSKIAICLESLKVFSTWKEAHGDDVDWKKGGYCFPVYTDKIENTLRGMLPVQKKHDLNIDWVDADTIRRVIPGVNLDGLRGGTYSPDDGQASPLMMAVAMKRRAERLGATFRFNEPVTAINTHAGKITGVTTTKGVYHAPRVLNTAGANAREVGQLTGTDLPVFPDCHEAGISAPVEMFLDPLVVDLRPGPGGHSANFYFGQNAHGQIIFCYTPEPAILGKDIDATSEFLPHVAQRLITLIPRLKNLVIRRTWRGLYPMTPDGSPILDSVREIDGLYVAVGMCGQGFMMGPGVGLNMASLIADGHPVMPPELFKEFTLYGDFYKKKEALK